MFVHRDVSGVELLMNNHQSLKAEIDTREDNFSGCISLGKELLSRSHYASEEVIIWAYGFPDFSTFAAP